MSSFFYSPPSSFSSSSELSCFLAAAAFLPVETFDYFLDVFLTGSSSLSSESSSELAAFLAGALAAGFPLVGRTLTSSSLDESSSDELAAFLAAGLPFTGAATTLPLGLISSESSESSESSLDSTFFLLTTAACPFLACLSVPLLEALEATLSLFPATSTFLAGTLATTLSESSESSDELSESTFLTGAFLATIFSACFLSLFFFSSASTDCFLEDDLESALVALIYKERG